MFGVYGPNNYVQMPLATMFKDEVKKSHSIDTINLGLEAHRNANTELDAYRTVLSSQRMRTPWRLQTSL